MKSENILNALNDIDHDLVEDAEKKHKKSEKLLFLKWGAIAACLVLVVGLVWSAFAPPKIPVYKKALFSAAQIGEMMYKPSYSGTTNAYDEILVNNPSELGIQPIPDSEYLDCWLYNPPKREIDPAVLSAFIDAKLPEICAKLGTDVPSYEISDLYSWCKSDISQLDGEKHDFSAFQSDLWQLVSISPSAWPKEEAAIVLEGMPIQFSQGLTDGDILKYLSQVKGQFFELFDVSFSDTRIEHEPDGISVYLYNKSEHVLNESAATPVTDHIFLRLHASKDGTVMYCFSATYRQYRSGADERYTFTQLRRIPLEDAEALLYHGYVFGGHICKLCTAAQDSISFRNYDYVGFDYYNGYPFYTFYKKIKTDEQGQQTYAKTHVAAFEVSGYKEYFKAQEADHNSQ